MKLSKSLLFGTAIYCAIALTASAQDSYSAAEEDESRQLQTVVVTARKIEENLQTAPIAVTTLDAELLQARGATSPDDILNYTPGVTFDRVSPLEQTISIRGIASGSEGTSADAGVVFMVDGEVISRDFMRSSAVFDLAQVEVLRGPQGTAYGRNATAGIVHFRSQRPTFDNESSVRFDAGDYNFIEAEGAVNYAVSDRSAFRVSAFRSERDGFSRNALSGADIDFSETSAIRAQYLYETEGGTTFLLRSHYSDEAFGPPPRKSADPSQPFESPFTSYIEPSADRYEVINSDVDGFERQIYGGSAEIVSDLGPLRLTSLTTYRSGESTFNVDFFGTPEDLLVAKGYDQTESFSQELRFDNASEGGALQYVGGLFYFTEDTVRSEDRAILVLPQLPFLATEQVFSERNKTDSYGIFAELEYEVSDATTLGFGARYSSDEKDFSVFHDSNGALADFFIDTSEGPVEANPNDEFSAVTYRASVDHRLSEDLFVYGKVSRGFKSGGFNSEPFNLEAATTSFDEETVTSYEAGLKAEFFDRTFRLNSALFLNKFDDIQEEFFLPSGAATISNVASATTSGLETEWVWLANDHFDFNGSFALFEHSYDDFVDADGNDLSGNKLANVPDWTFRFGGAAYLPLATQGDLQLRVDYRIRDDVFDSAENDPAGTIPGRGVLDSRLTWTAPAEKYSVSLWGRNLTDTAEIQAAGVQSFFSQRSRIYGEPRTIGVSFNLKLGAS
jgi:iron complex outermembrane receptor protein